MWSLGNAGAGREGREIFPAIPCGTGSPELAFLRGTALPAAVPRWDGRVQLCNYTAVIRTSCPKHSRGRGEKGSAHVGKLPDLEYLKGIFLPAWHEQVGSWPGLRAGAGMDKELPLPFHPSGDVRHGAGCAERGRKKIKKWGRQLRSNISQALGSPKQPWGSCGCSSRESLMGH